MYLYSYSAPHRQTCLHVSFQTLSSLTDKAGSSVGSVWSFDKPRRAMKNKMLFFCLFFNSDSKKMVLSRSVWEVHTLQLQSKTARGKFQTLSEILESSVTDAQTTSLNCRSAAWNDEITWCCLDNNKQINTEWKTWGCVNRNLLSLMDWLTDLTRSPSS